MASEMDEAKKLNRIELDKQRQKSQINAALIAKKKFIDLHFDTSSNVNNLNAEMFNDVMKTNEKVSICP